MSTISNASTSYHQLPNPYTPMAFLPSAAEGILLYEIYGIIWSLGALLWDVILHLPQDYKLLTRYRINISMVVYCVSRLSTLAYVLGLAISKTAPINDCNIFRHINMIFPFTLPSTTLLFVFRVRALYSNNQYVVAFSFISWLVVLASSFTVPISSRAVNIGITKYCVATKPKSFISFAIIYPTIHETLVFLATSWAFLRNSFTDINLSNGFRVMVMGKFLPAFSRSILHNGQGYYLVSLISFLIFTVTFYDPWAPSSVPTLLAWPALVMLNNMSCYIYRNIRLGIYRENSINTSAIDKALRPFPNQYELSSYSGSSRAPATTSGDDPQR